MKRVVARRGRDHRTEPRVIRKLCDGGGDGCGTMNESPIQSADDSILQRAVQCLRSDLPKAIALDETRMTITPETDRPPDT